MSLAPSISSSTCGVPALIASGQPDLAVDGELAGLALVEHDDVALIGIARPQRVGEPGWIGVAGC